jgi:hypothetical protein
VGCQLNCYQALRLLCLKGHVRARGSTLTTSVASDKKQVNLCVLKHLIFEDVEQNKYWLSTLSGWARFCSEIAYRPMTILWTRRFKVPVI